MNLENLSKKVCVIGQGYVGLPLSMACADAGYDVLGIDSDSHRVELITSGDSPVPDVSSSVLRNHLAGSKYRATAIYEEAAGFEVAIITVPTPLDSGEPDLRFIESSALSISTHLSEGALVILESTTYPGTTEELVQPILESGSGLIGGTDFFLGYSPERIDPGNETWNLLNTPKVVSGVNQQSLERVEDFYRSVGIQTVPVSGTREAELTKLLENTFRHVNIALVNELARFAGHLGVNIWEAIEAASTKPFGFLPFTPGPGVGGHCLPVDPSYLSWAIKETSGEPFQFVELANSINSSMPQLVMDRIEHELQEDSKSLHSSSVVLFGLAYKPNTSDLRESPSTALAKLLHKTGAKVFAFDPLVNDRDWPEFIQRFTKSSTLKFDAGVMLTPHTVFGQDLPISSCGFVLDTRNVLAGPTIVRF